MPMVKLTDKEAQMLAFEREIGALSRTRLADAFHVTVRTVHDWVAAGLPRNPDGTFSLQEAIQWRLERARERRNRGF